MQVLHIVSIGYRGLVACDLTSLPSTQYCTWARRHRGNFTFLMTDLRYNTSKQLSCDGDCRQQHRDRWKQHRYQLPIDCMQLCRLVDDPRPMVAELEHMCDDWQAGWGRCSQRRCQ
jgi:hypothetical protein